MTTRSICVRIKGVIRSTRITTSLGALVAAGALSIATPDFAQAATYEQGNPDSERTARDGDGDADARAHASRGGAFSIFGDADGGGTEVVLETNPNTVAKAQGSILKRVPVETARTASSSATPAPRERTSSDVTATPTSG